jgi:hypothetical protein
MVTTSEKEEALSQSAGKDKHHDGEASIGRQWHRVKTHPINDDGRLEEVSTLDRQGGGGQSAWWGCPP